MKYTSTRNTNISVSGAEAIVKGISEEGGLFVPQEFPTLSKNEITAMCDMDYPARAALVLHKFLDEFSREELLNFAEKAYSRFEDNDACPLAKIDDDLFVLELWHGPTSAFKDLALQIMPYLLVASKKKLGKDERTLILVATSGDTGKAALEGFCNVSGTDIIVFYPDSGVSEMQKLQMLTQEGENVNVVGIKGNFDDAQTAVKKVFTDIEFSKELAKKNIKMSSANSINWGRLAPQIAYYISAYVDLVESGEIANGDKINFIVPTGNFGDVLAGFYAYKMGLPVGKLIVASNSNNVLADFFHTGEYDIRRKFFKTMSPSMDILISSNLERLIFEIMDKDGEKVRELYQTLAKDGHFNIDVELLNDTIFEAAWADEEETKSAIYNFFDLYDYALDPHTAVAASVYTDYIDEVGDETPCVILSTASPFKFAPDVYNALGVSKIKDAFKAIPLLEMMTALDAPAALKELKNKPILHRLIVEPNMVKDAVAKMLEKK
ncbi:MAG TPA: threonine synthase [Clostridia bacterium]|nr:threonine synthase [Clostridia bacterium]